MKTREKLLNAIYPSVTCDVCGAELPLKHRRKNDYPLCDNCFSMLKRHNYECLLWDKTIVYQCFLYDDMTRKIVLDCKEHGKTYLARTMAEFMFETIKKSGEIFDAVCFVPSFIKKKRKRGYCHAEIIAKFLALKLEKPLISALKQIKEIKDQTGLNKEERAINVDGSYAIDKKVDGMKLLLVDDIVSSGATMHECVKVLTNAGAKNVSVICFASTARLC